MTETTNPQPSFRAVFTVTIETRKGGDYYYDRDDLVRNVTPWIEGALEDRDDIRDVTVVEAEDEAPADRAAILREAEAKAREVVAKLWGGGITQTELDRTAGARTVEWEIGQLAAQAELRRMADEAQPSSSATCPHCKHWYVTSEPGAHEDSCPMKPDPSRVADEAQQPETQALAAALDGLHTLIATSSRDWQMYRVDAWIWAVLCGWDCEQTEHDDTCTHGAMEETAAMHGWDDATVAKARRCRAAVRALTDPAVVSQPSKEA